MPITNCWVCGKLFEAGSEEYANEPQRKCQRCLGFVKSFNYFLKFKNGEWMWDELSLGTINRVYPYIDTDEILRKTSMPKYHIGDLVTFEVNGERLSSRIVAVVLDGVLEINVRLQEYSILDRPVQYEFPDQQKRHITAVMDKILGFTAIVDSEYARHVLDQVRHGE
jgi:hypothetical protein